MNFKDINELKNDAQNVLSKDKTKYGKVIITISVLFGITTLAIVLLSAFDFGEFKLGYISFGFLGGAGYGLALSILFCPKSYLMSEAGQVWCKIAGTKNIIIVKLICLFLIILITAPVVWIFYDEYFNKN